MKPSSEITALITEVETHSPAYEAGFEPGCKLTALNGLPITDILDWRWRSEEPVITLSYIDLDGDRGTLTLEREENEPWGFTFDGVVFDGVRPCENACSFCFVRQLPEGLRPSLFLHDDDYRLSFLNGTFTTLSNLHEEDIARIKEQHLSPLHVSLQVVSPQKRKSLLGPKSLQGFTYLKELLAAGMQCYGQIVLVPGENDGAYLEETLDWAANQPGILGVAVVPLGYTKYQHRFAASYEDSAKAREVLDLLSRYQKAKKAEGQTPWVFGADEFYLNAYGSSVLDWLPPAEFYGDFDLFEDGVGLVRTVVDQWQSPEVKAQALELAASLQESQNQVYYISGEAQRPYFGKLIADAGLDGLLIPLYIPNDFFGGNVNVTGLLCGVDLIKALKSTAAKNPEAIFVIPSIVFNDDGLTLDDFSVSAIAEEAQVKASVVSLNPKDYLQEIADLLAAE